MGSGSKMVEMSQSNMLTSGAQKVATNNSPAQKVAVMNSASHKVPATIVLHRKELP